MHASAVSDAPELPARLEVLPFASAEPKLEVIDPARPITVTVSPKHGVEHTLEFSERWAARGLDVIPHITARMVTSRDDAIELAARIRVAGFSEIFVIGGDQSPPLGLFDSAGQLLDVIAPLLGSVRIGVAGYPEGHPAISDVTLADALTAKSSVASTIVTQLCFDTDTILRWIRSIRDRGIVTPVLVGVPGVVERTKLLELATRVGVGASTRFLRKNLKASAKLLLRNTYEPTDLVDEVTNAAAADPSLGIAGFHVFTFNQIEPTEAWLRARSTAPVRAI
jgi:methylenetetrahydrofolate reductase (NADPH)